MAYPDDIIKESLKEFKLQKSRRRRRKIEKLLNYYTNTSTWQYIQRYFDAKSFVILYVSGYSLSPVLSS